MRRIVVLISREPADNLPAVLAAQADGFNGQVVAVVSSSEFAPGLGLAERWDVPSEVLSYDDHCRAGKPHALYEEELARLLQRYSPDLILLDGWQLELTERFLRYFPWRVLAVTQGLLGEDQRPVRCPDGSNGDPLFGLAGASAVQAVLAGDHTYTGSTVYVVVGKGEEGPVVSRSFVQIEPNDTAPRLTDRIKRKERETVLFALRELCMEIKTVT